MTGREPWFQFLRGFLIWRFSRYGDGHFSVNATRWFYFTNHRYVGEHRYFVRVGPRRDRSWRKNFGPRQPATSRDSSSQSVPRP